MRFTPSAVDGLPDVAEVAVYPDRIGILAGGTWWGFTFQSFAEEEQPRLPAWLHRFVTSCPPTVGESYFCRERYDKSYITFFTEPKITVHMPSEGPTLSPDSHFWRAHETIRRGGFRVHDLNRGPRPQPDAFWDGAPILGRMFALALLNWILCAIIWASIGGDPIETKPSVDGLVLDQHGKRTAVTQGRWLFSLFYTSASLVLMPAVTAVVAARMFRKMPKETDAQKINAAVMVLFILGCCFWCYLITRAAVGTYLDWHRHFH